MTSGLGLEPTRVHGGFVVTISGGPETCTATVAAGQCNLVLTSTGTRTITATYQGDQNNQPSSDTELHTVIQAGTTTTITGDAPDPSVAGQVVTVNYTVVAAAPGAGTPTGNVVVTVSGGAETCTGTVAARRRPLTRRNLHRRFDHHKGPLDLGVDIAHLRRKFR